MVMYELDNLIRNINKHWVAKIKEVENDPEGLKQLIIDTLHECKVAMILLHPCTPANIEKLAEDLGVGEEIFNWDTINDPIYNFVADKNNYRPKSIPPKYDFFTCYR